MGLDQRPASWDGNDRPKISAKLKVCDCRAFAAYCGMREPEPVTTALLGRSWQDTQ